MFYRSFYDAIEVSGMSDAEQLACFRAICRYGIYGTEPELEGFPAAIFTIAKANLDANARKREDGQKGGRPKKKTTGFSENNHRFSESESTENENETETENENENETETETETSASGTHEPPSLEEVESFFEGTTANPIVFYNHYAAVGWKLRGEPVVDWQALARKWIENERKENHSVREQNAASCKSKWENLPGVINL